MSRVLLLLAVAIAAAALALRGDSPATGTAPQSVVVGVGDTIEVDGAPIGCAVTRRGERITLECRRGGKLKGTYVSLFDQRRVQVARFRSKDEAQVIFTARHRGKARMCGAGKAARATSRGHCR